MQKAHPKYVPLTLTMVHKLYLEHQKNKTESPLIINYLWTDGADPNKHPKTELYPYKFIPDGSIKIVKHDKSGDKKQVIPDYLTHDKIRYPYPPKTNKQPSPDLFFYLGGKHKFDEHDGFFESQMQICRGKYLNSLSDSCISGHNWVINSNYSPKNNKTQLAKFVNKYPVKKLTRKATKFN
jgi:hypothetical protein